MHLQDFLNGVCTHTIWVTEKRLTYYTGIASDLGAPLRLFFWPSACCKTQ